MTIQVDLTPILPLTFLVVWACALLLVDLFIPDDRKGITAALSALGLALALGWTLTQIGREPLDAFNGMVVLDGFSVFVNALLLVSGLLGIALSFGYIKRMKIERGEYYTLMLFSISGMMLMAQASDLIVVFLALELLSIPLYVLAGVRFAPVRSREEAGASGIFLLGRGPPTGILFVLRKPALGSTGADRGTHVPLGGRIGGKFPWGLRNGGNPQSPWASLKPIPGRRGPFLFLVGWEPSGLFTRNLCAREGPPPFFYK